MRSIISVTAFTLACFGAPAVPAQTVDPAAQVAEDYISRQGIIFSDTYTFDDGFAAEFDVDVPVPFRLLVPQFSGVSTGTFLQPDGGAFVAFVFTHMIDADAGIEAFLENLQVTDAIIPMVPEAQDPEQSRVELTAQLLREQVFPNAIGSFPEAELLVLEQIELGNVSNAVQMIGSHIRPETGARELVRVVIFPHPDQPESLMVMSRLNLSLVPAVDGDTLAASITGRILSRWEYLDLAEQAR